MKAEIVKAVDSAVNQPQNVVRPTMNPWVLHFQKLGLELKCPLCLNLLHRPSLLPCDHIFCNSCLPKTTQLGLQCPLCNVQYIDQDLRSMPFIENMVTIYKSLDAAFNASIFQSPSSGVDCTDKQSFKATWQVNSIGGQAKLSLTSDKLAHVQSNRSVEIGVQKSGLVENFYVRGEAKDEEGAIVGFKGDGCRKMGVLQGSGQIDMNREDQLSLGSPPSFGDNKDSENDSSQGCDNSPHNYQAAILVQPSADNRRRQERPDSSASETEEGHLRDSKRYKKLNYSPLDMCANNVDHAKGDVNQAKNLGNGSPLQAAAIVNDSFSQKTFCGFCQSSKITQNTGPMLHFMNDKPVDGVEATLSNAIHVHAMCIEWAPQVYYVGETVKNLKEELARGTKLKCCKCGLKGAALGCYLKSCRRSYHAPCAMEIAKCRWDYDNFLVLCPAHCSVKFPNEKSKKTGKHIVKVSPVPTSITPQQSNFWAASPNGAKDWVFCGSALSSEEKCLLVEFGSMIGVPVTKFWRSNVTHVIAATDSEGACTRTLKVLMAIVNGKWVLTIDWIKACMQSMRHMDEEPYEVRLDNHGSCDGPRNGRLSALDNAPKLFNGFDFYFVGDFVSGYKEDIQNLVIAAGGTVLKSKEELVVQREDLVAHSRTLVVYNLEPPQGCELGDEVSIIWHRVNEAEDLAAKVGAQVIGHTWLLESISAYKLRPFVK